MIAPSCLVPGCGNRIGERAPPFCRAHQKRIAPALWKRIRHKWRAKGERPAGNRLKALVLEAARKIYREGVTSEKVG